MKDDLTEKLFAYVDSLQPIIYINHFDPHIVDGALKRFSECGTKIELYDNALGRLDFETRAPGSQYLDLPSFLECERGEGFYSPMILVLFDVHESLSDQKVVALLKRMAVDNLNREQYNLSVFIISSRLVIPSELEKYITVLDIPVPESNEISSIISEFGKANEIDIEKDLVGDLAISFKGLDRQQIQQILNLAYQDGGNISHTDKRLILQEKKQIIKKVGMLEYIESADQFNSIGGLQSLKHYLWKKSRIFKDLSAASEFGVEIPKGILILGMPGCGKSLAAKATASLFDVSLVRLDVGRLLGKYVGESEENMSRALKLAEAISPCVLWIDEIEKAFSGVGESGGASDVTTRLFGFFLTWLQEKKDTVYVVATANNISKIPPEFLRKGRFDELFFTSLPDENERLEILRIHLEKRKKMGLGISLSQIANKTNGCNGADLEELVKEAIEIAFSDNRRPVTTEDLLEARKNQKSITELMSEKLKQLEAQCREMNFKSANKAVEDASFERAMTQQSGERPRTGETRVRGRRRRHKFSQQSGERPRTGETSKIPHPFCWWKPWLDNN